jgi:hypothetical protein
MSSGIRRCAFGRQCVIAELHVGDYWRSTSRQLTTGLKSRNLIVGANVSSCSMVKRLVVSEGREELTTKAATCC